MTFWVVCLLACRSLHLSVCLSVSLSSAQPLAAFFLASGFCCRAVQALLKLMAVQALLKLRSCTMLVTSFPCLAFLRLWLASGRKTFPHEPTSGALSLPGNQAWAALLFCKKVSETENLQFRPCRPNCLWGGGPFGLHLEYAGAWACEGVFWVDMQGFLLQCHVLAHEFLTTFDQLFAVEDFQVPEHVCTVLGHIVNSFVMHAALLQFLAFCQRLEYVSAKCLTSAALASSTAAFPGF